MSQEFALGQKGRNEHILELLMLHDRALALAFESQNTSFINDAHLHEEDDCEDLNETVFTANVLCLFGAKVYQHVEVLVRWLEENIERRLWLFYDQISQVKNLLAHTSCINLLQHPRVDLIWLGGAHADASLSLEHIRANLPFIAYRLSWQLIGRSIAFWVSAKLAQVLSPVIRSFQDHLLMYKRNHEAMSYECEYFGAQGLEHLFKNLRNSPWDYLFETTFPLENRDVVICGAGPSINTYFPLLPQITSRAIVIAAGSAITVLDRAGIKPHLFFGIDPFVNQIDRLSRITCIDTCTFYRPRWHSTAKNMIFGPKILVGGKTGYRFFDKAYELNRAHEVSEGLNVVSFALNWAALSGAKRIFLLGVDLACQNHLYGGNLQELHPQLSKNHGGKSPHIQELCEDGKMRGTHTQWLAERAFLEQFFDEHPEIELWRSSSSGLKTRIPHISSEEVLDKIVRFQRDIQNETWARIQLNPTLKDAKSELGESVQKKIKDLEENALQCHDALMRWLNFYSCLQTVSIKDLPIIDFQQMGSLKELDESQTLERIETEIKCSQAYEEILVFWDMIMLEKLASQEAGMIRALSCSEHIIDPRSVQLFFKHLRFMHLQKGIELIMSNLKKELTARENYE